jgi:adenylate kinase family enzyme
VKPKPTSTVSNIPSLDSYITQKVNIESNEQFSILKYTIRQTNEITEIANALGAEHVVHLLTLTPRRLAYYETIACIETEVKQYNSSDLSAIVQDVYKNHIIPLLKSTNQPSEKTLEKVIFERIHNNIQTSLEQALAVFLKFNVANNDIPDIKSLNEKQRYYLREIKETYNKVKIRIDNGLYTPGEHSFTDNHLSIVQKIVYDKFYNQKMREEIEQLIQPYISNIIDSKQVYYPKHTINGNTVPLRRLSLQTGSDRHTFMIIGAPASGKGTVFGMSIIDAENLGIEESNIVKVNTDSYRSLVSNPKELGPNTINHASFNHEESYLISKNIYRHLNKKVLSNEGAPHILIDTVYPTQEKINLATLDGGKLHLNCVTIPVETSIKWAAERGRKTGRFIDTTLLRRAHKDISTDLHNILIANKDSNIEYTIVDNNVPRGKIPILIEEGNFKAKNIKIWDYKRSKEFLEKKDLNQNLTTDLVLASSNRTLSSLSSITKLQQAGLNVEYDKNIPEMPAPRIKPSIKIRKALSHKSKTHTNNITPHTLKKRGKKTKTRV